MKTTLRAIAFLVIAGLVGYGFIRAVPTLVFTIAKMRKPVPVNTVYHAPPTDAALRQVVLPNPDFVYSICFYNLSQTDLILTGEFTDTTQYCSLAFYDDQLQPYYVQNNFQGFKSKFNLRLSYVNRVQRTLRAKTKQGAVLFRMLAVDPAQKANAIRLQQKFKALAVAQND